MENLLRVLILEDSQSDALLLVRQFNRTDYQIEHLRVDSVVDMEAALDSAEWDVILADYAMPSFSPFDGLELMRSKGIDIPFIVISGTVGEEAAVNVMKAGAGDFIVKANLNRLIPAIERELREAEERRKRRQAEDALRESEKLFRTLADAAPVMIWRSGVDKLCDYFSKGWLLFTGRTMEEEIGNGWTMGVHLDDYDRCMRTYTAAFDAREAFTMEYRLRRYDGEFRWIIDTGTPRTTESGEFLGYVGSCIDISERKEAEIALENRNRALTVLQVVAQEIAEELDVPNLLRRLIKRAADLLDAGQGSGIYLYNEEAEALRLEAAIGVNFSHVGALLRLDEGVAGRVFRTKQPLIVNDYNHWNERIEALVSNSPSAVMGVPLLIKGEVAGVLLVIADSRQRLFDEPDLQLAEMLATQAASALHNARLFSAAQREIAERKHTEEALRESEGRWRSLTEHSPELVLTLDTELNIKFANRASPNLTVVELIDTPLYTLVNPEQRSEVKAILEGVLATKKWASYETVYHAPDSDIFYESIAAPLVDGEEVVGLTISSRDITERKQAESALQEHERLLNLLHAEQEWNAAIQRTMKVFSHELRNPLTVIETSSNMLIRYADQLSPERVLEKLTSISSHVRQIDHIIEDVVHVVQSALHHEDFHPRQIDLEKICRVTIGELQATIGADHALVFETDGQIKNLYADEKLITRILINLLGNATKYSPSGSEIRLELRHEDGAALSVSDQGMGISPEDQSRIFDPYFRAEHAVSIQGTGLGLSIVRDCVDLHNGQISVQSEVGVGTTFKVWLPLGGAS